MGGGRAKTIGAEASTSPVPGRPQLIAHEFGPNVSQSGSPGIVGSVSAYGPAGADGKYALVLQYVFAPRCAATTK